MSRTGEDEFTGDTARPKIWTGGVYLTKYQNGFLWGGMGLIQGQDGCP